MGGKATLLKGDLGDLTLKLSRESARFVDLFAGAASVSHFVAEREAIPVLSVDPQAFSKVLALGITARTDACSADLIQRQVIDVARTAYQLDRSRSRYEALGVPTTKKEVMAARALCERQRRVHRFIPAHYGGHYFSPSQALGLHYLRLASLDLEGPCAWLAMSALLQTASRVSASPGHTAQPFQPSERLLPFIGAAWARNVFDVYRDICNDISARHALVPGRALVENSASIVPKLSDGDLVFCDPPYSEVQYSRFYHVLEGIARGGWPSVSGAGRAPTQSMRYRSEFSARSASFTAFRALLDGLSESRSTVLMTFPAEAASNGMSGGQVLAMARERFHVEEVEVAHVHSTLGGPRQVEGMLLPRGARRELKELILVLKPA